MVENSLNVKNFILVLFIASLLASINFLGIFGVYGEAIPYPREETLIMTETATPVVFDSFNPFIPGGVEGAYGFHCLVKEHLWYINYATGERVYWLATGWEYGADYKSMILHLRKGVTWNDGEPFTAKDIVFEINTIKTHPALYWSAFFQEWVSEIRALDDYTVVINFTKPNPRFHLDIKGLPIAMPEHIWKDVDPTTFKNNPPVATGPFKLLKAIPELKMFIWVRRDDYWGKALGYFPAMKYVIWKQSPPVDLEFAEWVKAEIDHPHRVSYSKEVMKMALATNPNCTYVSFHDPCPRGIWINCAKYPLSLREVRWAISYCVNREVMAKLWPYTIEPTTPSTFPWADWAGLRQYVFPDVFEKYKIEYNPEKAAKILDDLGFKPGPDGIRVTPNGTRLSWTILVPEWVVEYEGRVVAAGLAEELRKIGIEAEMKVVTWPVFDELTSTGKFDLTSHWLCTPMPWNSDPFYLYNHLHSKWIKPIGERAVNNWVRLNCPELDEIIDKTESMSPDDPEIIPLYKKAIEIFMRELPAIPVVETSFSMPWQTTYWTGWPTKENFYAWPPSWWSEFLFVVLSIKPVRVAPPVVITYLSVWITGAVDAFTGADGKTYGPFKAGEFVTIPKEDADRLIAEGLASLTAPVPAEIPEIAKSVEKLKADMESVKADIAALSGTVAGLAKDETVKALRDALAGMQSMVYASMAVSAITLILVLVTLAMVLKRKA
jgi:peptide/nickel transport system substrate-binding protein